MKKIAAFLILFYSINSFSQNVITEDNAIYDIKGIEVKPEIPEALIKNLEQAGFKIKSDSKNFSIFVVEKDGSLGDIKIYGKMDAAQTAELIKILENSPKWKPEKYNGKNVRVKYAIGFK